jgi:uncharacterized protein (DUF433 family)
VNYKKIIVNKIMITQELKQQILSLSLEERDEIVRLIREQGNVWTGINKTPGVVGGDACIRNMRIPVWSLVEYRQMGASDSRILEAYPQLTANDLANAWAYAEAFPDEIAEAITANEEAMND